MGIPVIVKVVVPGLYEPVTPDGNPVIVAPVELPPRRYVIFVIGIFIHIAWPFVPTAEDKLMIEFGFTVIVPLKEALTHGPEVVTV